MAVLMEMEFEATPDQYDAVDRALDIGSDPPKGLIAHTARVEGGKMRVVDVWESPEDFGAFAENRLGPTVRQTLGDDAPDGAPDPTFTELHNAYSA
jgi:hypothetical protein